MKRAGDKRARDRGELTLPPISEAEVTAQVVAAARLLGLNLERRNTGGAHFADRYVTFGEEGDPDWECTLPGGRRCGIEIKRPGKRPTEAQMKKLRQLNADGAVGLWTDDAEAFLRLMPYLISGQCRVEIDDEGIPWVTDERRAE